MIAFLRKKIKRNKIIFINGTDLNLKGELIFGVDPVHGVLNVVIDFENFQTRYKSLYPIGFFDWYLKMGNCCFPNNVKLKDYVLEDEMLRPEGEYIFLKNLIAIWWGLI